MIEEIQKLTGCSEEMAKRVVIERENRAKYLEDQISKMPNREFSFKEAMKLSYENPYTTTDAEAYALSEKYDQELSREKFRNQEIKETMEENMSAFKKSGFPERNMKADVKMEGKWLDAFNVTIGILKKGGGIIGLYGKNGTGKTQIALESIKSVLSEFKKHASVKYTTAMDVFMEIKSTYRKESKISECDVVDNFSYATFLVIDEFEKNSQSEWEMNMLFHIINKRYGMNKPTILISNMGQQEFAGTLGASILSRMSDCGGLIECNWESFRGRKP